MAELSAAAKSMGVKFRRLKAAKHFSNTNRPNKPTPRQPPISARHELVKAAAAKARMNEAEAQAILDFVLTKRSSAFAELLAEFIFTARMMIDEEIPAVRSLRNHKEEERARLEKYEKDLEAWKRGQQVYAEELHIKGDPFKKDWEIVLAEFKKDAEQGEFHMKNITPQSRMIIGYLRQNGIVSISDGYFSVDWEGLAAFDTNKKGNMAGWFAKRLKEEEV